MSRTVRLVAAAALAAAVLPAFGGSTSGAVADDSLYRPATSFKPSGESRVAPDRFHAVRVDLAQARSLLSGAPRAADRSEFVFEVPTPSGSTERFSIHQTRTMERKLAAAHPDITTYAGRSLDHRGTTIALDLTPLGLHAAVRGPNGQGAWYVDPAYNKPGTAVHLSYYGGAMPRAEEEFVEREAPEVHHEATKQMKDTAGGGPVTQKVYRLAFLTDPSYFEYFDSNADSVVAAKVTLINRVNQIYNDDLAIKMILIDETDDLSLETEAEATGPNGACGSHPCFDAEPGDPEFTGHIDYCDVGTLGRNRIVLGQMVGASNYDIGHIGLGKNGGGIAYLGVVGWDYKGGGCTGLPDPIGDFYAIDYVAHEFGHQYAGNHTYFACGGSSNDPTGIEPGSGVTVMAYAGICGPDNLQPHSDPYFSAATVDEVNAYTNNPTLPTIEVQTVSLRDFDETGEKLMLSFGGPPQQIAFEDYDAESVETAVEALTGQDVTVAQWGYDPFGHHAEYPAPVEAIDTTGFQVIFAPSPNPEDPQLPDGVEAEDEPAITVAATGDATGFVGETAQGGEAKNDGNEQIPTGNTAPTAKAPANKTLPIRTPFTLKGSGKDADGGKPTLLWEQVDHGPEAIDLVSSAKVFGPLFRVFGEIAHVTDEGTLQSPSPGQNLATRNGTRTFPDLAQVLKGNTNAKTGKCPEFTPENGDEPVPFRLVDCYSEFLPIAGYRGTPGEGKAMHFRLTARDGFATGGGLGFDEMTLKIDPKAGPFLVKSFAKGGSVKGGRSEVIEWKVNGTKKLAKNVKILLSTDGGNSWKTLKRKTANDGKVSVRFPRKRTTNARIRIQAVGNYFFDVNDKAFKIK